MDWSIVASNGFAIVSFLCAYYWYIKAKKEKVPRYSLNDELILRSSKATLPDLGVDITISGVPVTELRRCIFVFWNAGRETIRASDVIDGAITLQLSGSVVGDVKAVGSRPACKAVANTQGDVIDLQFAFLDYRDVIYVSALYDGPKAAPKLQGTIMGVPHDGFKKMTGRLVWNLEEEDDDGKESRTEPKEYKQRTALRLAFFTSSVAILATKSLWISLTPIRFIEPFFTIFLVIIVLCGLVSIILLLPESVLLKWMDGRFPLSGIKAISDQLDQQSQTRPPSSRTKSDTP